MASGLLYCVLMKSVARMWLQVLEERYGVGREFAGHLLPMLERLAGQKPTIDEWDQMFHGVAAAYRTGRRNARSSEAHHEAGVLVDEFSDELRKLEESLKVIGACLERLRQQVIPPPATLARSLH